jgi:DNA invertase Pin-like site-specific DNA recombinase
MAGLSAAKKRGRQGGRPRAISEEKMRAISEALSTGTSKAAVCRTFNVKRTTLYDALGAYQGKFPTLLLVPS